jgi:hypothetical protein
VKRGRSVETDELQRVHPLRVSGAPLGLSVLGCRSRR